MTKRLFIALLIIGIAVGFGAYNLNVVRANDLVAIGDLEAGDLIRGETFPAVYYYSVDGFRYVFPNQKAYDTWYDNFDDVRWVSDADLTTIQIGGNVTYRPGAKMIKINSDPKTYAVGADGSLYHVATEDAAVALYGTEWNTMIDDVPDGFFGNYTQTNEQVTGTADFDVDAVMAASPDVDADKGLVAPADIEITDNAYSDIEVTISAGANVRWVNNGADNHTVTSDALTWGSGTMAPGVQYIKKFEEAGTYTYFCSYFPSMTGTVIVE